MSAGRNASTPERLQRVISRDNSRVCFGILPPRGRILKLSGCQPEVRPWDHVWQGLPTWIQGTDVFDRRLFLSLDWKSGMSVPTDIAIAYLIQGSFYGHSIYATIYMDAWRKDSAVMVVHHIITLALICFSYAFRYFSSGFCFMASQLWRRQLFKAASASSDTIMWGSWCCFSMTSMTSSWSSASSTSTWRPGEEVTTCSTTCSPTWALSASASHGQFQQNIVFVLWQS